MRHIFTRFLKKKNNAGNDTKAIIDGVCDTIGGVVSTAMALSSNNPQASLIAGSSAPVISMGLKSIIKGVFNDQSSETEVNRLRIYIETAKMVYDNNVKLGKTVVNSLFLASYNPPNKGIDFEEVFEGLLKTVKDDTIKLKSEIYGRFLGNLPFRGDIDASNVLFLKNIIMDLSVTELCILEVLRKSNYHKIDNLQSMIKKEDKPVLFEFYNGLLKLKNRSLLVPAPPYQLGNTIGNLRISKMGELICDAAEISQIDKDFLDVTKSILDSIENYVIGNSK